MVDDQTRQNIENSVGKTDAQIYGYNPINKDDSPKPNTEARVPRRPTQADYDNFWSEKSETQIYGYDPNDPIFNMNLFGLFRRRSRVIDDNEPARPNTDDDAEDVEFTVHRTNVPARNTNDNGGCLAALGRGLGYIAGIALAIGTGYQLAHLDNTVNGNYKDRPAIVEPGSTPELGNFARVTQRVPGRFGLGVIPTDRVTYLTDADKDGYFEPSQVYENNARVYPLEARSVTETVSDGELGDVSNLLNIVREDAQNAYGGKNE